VHRQDDLIDTTEMYLRCVLELEEDGVIPLRARIADRLGQSFPTVSQTVARMQRDGLVTVTGDRTIELTPPGRSAAIRVMRKHRLAECLLAGVLGLDWELVHDEACRWEHVMSDAVERRVLDILGHPAQSPYGNPIPGVSELGDHEAGGSPQAAMALSDMPPAITDVVMYRLGEPVQSDTGLLARLQQAGIRPGTSLTVTRTDSIIRIGTTGPGIEIDDTAAAHIFVTASQETPSATRHAARVPAAAGTSG
jgi:DtxR family transcriptional regulator, Mn-dependent transcriptional regulator